MKAVQLLIESKLPPELRRKDRNYTAKEISSVLSDIAVHHPESYNEISKLIADTGRNASYWQGETISLSDLKPLFDKKPILEQMESEIAALDRSAPDYEDQRELIWHKYNDVLMDTTAKLGRESQNAIAASVLSGARGKNPQLKMMLTTPGMYANSFGDTIPMFIRNSFGEGVRPAEFLASTYGARSTIISTKVATAKGGDLGKQLFGSAVDQIVSEADCHTANGIDLSSDDKSLRGRVLAKEVAGIPAGTVIGRSEMKKIRKEAPEHVLVRSALTCQSKEGVCQHCVGKFHNQKFPEIGYAIGAASAQAVSEPVTQGALGAKHTGGIAGAKRKFSGFAAVNQFVQSPEDYPDRGVVSEVEGVVQSVEEAPQGGHIVKIGDQEHYVPSGYDVLVKQGDTVEAGDQISDGLVDAADIVRLRGLGEGRKYYTDRLLEILEDSGLSSDRRNLEVVARGTINHIRASDDIGLPGVLPEDTIKYNRLAGEYAPPANTRQVEVSSAIGQYLQQPAMHFSIGTRLTKKQADQLKAAGFNQVYTSPDKPNFDPEMIRLRTANQGSDDWLQRMHGSYLKSNIQDAAVRGQDTNIKENPHFAPRLAYGKDFGKDTDRTGQF